MLCGKKLSGFSLIEISIVLVIIGVMTSAVLKGMHLLDSAKLQSFAQEICDVRFRFCEYAQSSDAIAKLESLVAETKFGVAYDCEVFFENERYKIQITKNKKGALTRKQAEMLSWKVSDLIGPDEVCFDDEGRTDGKIVEICGSGNEEEKQKVVVRILMN